jgi:hypothetical protein
MYRVDDRVQAVGTLSEDGFHREGETWEHAVAGDAGSVVFVDEDGDPVVRFDRTGTATVCDALLDIRPVVS